MTVALVLVTVAALMCAGFAVIVHLDRADEVRARERRAAGASMRDQLELDELERNGIGRLVRDAGEISGRAHPATGSAPWCATASGRGLPLRRGPRRWANPDHQPPRKDRHR